jgi:hypothetical protein
MDFHGYIIACYPLEISVMEGSFMDMNMIHCKGMDNPSYSSFLESSRLLSRSSRDKKLP